MTANNRPQARILIVEDNRDTRLLLKHLLRTAWPHRIVAGAEEALAAAASERYDAVLIDINLGDEMDGVDLLEHLRQDDCYAAVPIVALTAYAMPGDRQRFIESGFDGYLAKPFTRADLHRALRKALGEAAESA